MNGIDETHDPAMRSWVASANDSGGDFPLQNLPFGRFRAGASDELRAGVAIGDQLLDFAALGAARSWSDGELEWLQPLARGDLAVFMALPSATRRAARVWLSRALRERSPLEAVVAACLRAQADVRMAMPCEVGDYTDFYTGIHHATAVGKLFRPDQPLMPNYQWVPIGYHGRSSTLGVSGDTVRRPVGQTRGEGGPPQFGPCRRLDYELELGALIGPGNPQGEPVPISRAEENLFGLVLLNDWSARDIQAWEYQPLGPFLSKNFATTLSPWVVTMEALAPFRVPFERPPGDPQPLPYLDSPANRASGSIDIALEVWLQTAAMRERGEGPVRMSQSNFQRCVLDAGATGRAPHEQRLQPSPGRPVRHGHAVGSAARAGRLAPRVERRWQAARDTEGWGKPQFPGRRRYVDPPWRVRARGLAPDRIRALRGDDRIRARGFVPLTLVASQSYI